jgi:hypothetical protein
MCGPTLRLPTQRFRRSAKEPQSIRPRLYCSLTISKLLVVVDHGLIATPVGVVLLDDRFVFSGSALFDDGLIAVAITLNGYARGGSGTNSDSHVIGCRRHYVANTWNSQSRECKSPHQYAPSLLRTDSNSRFYGFVPTIIGGVKSASARVVCAVGRGTICQHMKQRSYRTYLFVHLKNQKVAQIVSSTK